VHHLILLVVVAGIGAGVGLRLARHAAAGLGAGAPGGPDPLLRFAAGILLVAGASAAALLPGFVLLYMYRVLAP
jgi:hypothetical protein